MHPYDRAMRVLVVSDTHLTATTIDRMPAEVWSMAEAADVVLHAGDVDLDMDDPSASASATISTLGRSP